MNLKTSDKLTASFLSERNKFYLWFSSFCELMRKIIIFFIVISFTIATLLYATNICLRFFKQNSFPWIAQLTGYIFAITPILGAALAIRNDENLKIEIFRKISKKWWIVLLTRLFSLIISAFFLNFFYQHFSQELQQGTVAIVFLKQWMLDVPYLFFFISSICFYLEGSWKALIKKN